MDISASASAGSNIANWDFFQVGVGAQVRFFITNNFIIKLYGFLDYHPLQVNQWATPPENIAISYSSALGSGGFSDVATGGGLTLTYIFGNSSLNNSDRRWTAVPGYPELSQH